MEAKNTNNFVGFYSFIWIIDVGGGDSNLVDFLLEEGFQTITVLDISAIAIEKGKNVNWKICDITDFKPSTTFDVWHDRATMTHLRIIDFIYQSKK